MPNNLSIRAYTSQIRSHYHEFHQLVLPLHGAINIKVGDYTGKVSIGDCVIIK
ncbi:MAG: AraC family transcriptional regulator, partial [Saccharospirillaceae bacterium]|nr:AraC family transcriptional regulator [Saccharospirillaceae bacterium]